MIKKDFKLFGGHIFGMITIKDFDSNIFDGRLTKLSVYIEDGKVEIKGLEDDI
jgi:hypothetical protein